MSNFGIREADHTVAERGTVCFMADSIHGVCLCFVERDRHAAEIGIAGGLMDCRHFAAAFINPHVEMIHHVGYRHRRPGHRLHLIRRESHGDSFFFNGRTVERNLLFILRAGR